MLAFRAMRVVQGLLGLLLVMAFCLQTALAVEAHLDVRVTPANAALKANIEAYVGSLGERDQAALQRFRRNAVEQAQKAPRLWVTTRRGSVAG